ncbi:Transcription initiation factor TFIID subunitb [Sesamum alatum]|uniref:Transcription initiation factor TFIID subunitb n=1 Tax=Sesamum alatum TaxID=300844 RepID=A0AAE2CTX3_9LAMI|nr:Transcription initiation factor TFIID subunitb [Sesamum alatum]
MDPNIVKFLEEDEDETMHSGADVDAFTAELNRDIERSDSASQQPSDSNNAALSQGNSQTTSQFLPQWQTLSHDGTVNFGSGQDLMVTEEKEQHLSQLEPHQHGLDSGNRKENDSLSHEFNPLPDNPLSDAGAQPQDDRNTFPVSQPIGSLISGEQSIHIQEPTREPNPDSQMHTLQNISNRPSVAMGSNDQLPMSMELNDQQSMSTGKGTQPTTSMGISNEQQVMSTVNQHTTGMGSQQATTSGMSNQQPMTSSNQQPGTALKLNKQVPFGMLLPIIQPQLDKDRAMQLHTLYFKLKKNEISKDGFVRHMRSIVGDQMLKMAVYKLQTQAARNSQTAPNQFQSQPQASARQMQVPSAQMPIDLSNSTGDSNAAKPREVESQADSQGVQVSQMSTSSSGVSQERKHPAFPTQGLNKQQHMHFSQTSFPTYGGAGSSYSPFSATNAASSTSLRPQTHDSQMKQAPAHQNMTVSHVGPSTQAMNMMNMSKFDRPHSFGDPKKTQAGNLTHVNSNTALQQNQVQWPSSASKEQKIGVSSSMTHVKQEPLDQSNEQQHKGLSSLSSTPVKQGPASGNLKDESFEIQSSRTGFTPPTSLVPSNSVSSSIPSAMETNILSNSRMPSLTSPIGPGNNSKAPLKKPLVGQKKPMEAPGSSPPSSKKQKVSGAFLDQSIEQLNDVTAVSGVNLREEEEQLFSGSKEDSRVSEASRRVVQEEEERLILQKIPLQKKVVEIMAKSGLKNMSNDVERCLSLRVDIEKPRHRTIITSDIRQQIMTINRKAREEWEKKQAETEKSQKLNDPENTTGVDGDKEKDESRAKSTKANKEEDDKMRTTAANVAVRAATGVGDMLSRWQLMIEAKQKQGGSDTTSGSQAGKDVARKPSATSSKNTRENQEAEKRDTSGAFATPASVRKVGRNQVVIPRVTRSISVKDVIGILEREPQMSKSTLLYRLYNKVSADAAAE